MLGFVVITAGVITLARRSTAHWEAEARARRAPPPDAEVENVARLRDELVRTVAAAGVAAVHAGRTLGAAGALVVGTPKRLRARPRRRPRRQTRQPR
jgi:hypothetical protein